MTFTPEQIANGKTWIAALRSGDYRQGRHFLVYEDNGPRYCCLGVAAMLFGLGAEQHGQTIYAEQAQVALGISNKKQNDLARLNDQGCTFAYIADRLEAFYGLTENAA